MAGFYFRFSERKPSFRQVFTELEATSLKMALFFYWDMVLDLSSYWIEAT